jgi:sigma-B regulation protein RsbQ
MPSVPVSPRTRHNVHISGLPAGRAVLFSHGFGGNQESWRFVAPAFEDAFRVVLFDHVGAVGSDLTGYTRARYDSLHGYADDLIELIETLGLRDIAFIGHSVSAMIGLLAANRRPDLFGDLILLCPSPRYIDADDYTGGFSQDAVDELLLAMDSNFASWSSAFAPMLAGDPDRPDISADVATGITRIDPEIATRFARVTLLSDSRRDLADVTVPTLILQSADDEIASPVVGRYVHERIPGSRLVVLEARGHVPHLAVPAEVVRHLRAHLAP